MNQLKRMFLGFFLMNLSHHSISLETDKLTGNQQEIKKAKTALEVFNIVDRLTSETIVLIDIDDTIITPVSTTFRAAPYNQMMDIIKKNKSQYPNFDGIISNWRLQRKTMLLDQEWPTVINRLKEKFEVYALTSIAVGKVGNIASMEEWRYTELKNLGIEFTENLSNPDLINHESNIQKSQDHPVFYKGIFLTGSATKKETLNAYKPFLNAKTVVMIDDRVSHLEDIDSFCRLHGMNYIGILFEGLLNFSEKPNAQIAEVQKNHLIKHEEWLEDEKAQEFIGKNYQKIH